MSLVWKSARPASPGWYWMRHGDKPDVIVRIHATPTGLWVRDHAPLVSMVAGLKWAGPILAPKEPSKQQLATLRYQLGGDYLAPRTHYWGAYPGDWEFVDRAEMLERVRRHLTGCYHGQAGYEADSSVVRLYSCVRRGGRWVRQQTETFTAKDFPAQAQTSGAGVAAAPVNENKANGQREGGSVAALPTAVGAEVRA